MADTHAHSYAPECPQCGHYSMVEQGENHWTCLNCGFVKDLPPSTTNTPPPTTEPETNSTSNTFMAILLLIILIVAAISL